jgi:hypothetical protein
MGGRVSRSRSNGEYKEAWGLGTVSPKSSKVAWVGNRELWHCPIESVSCWVVAGISRNGDGV